MWLPFSVRARHELSETLVGQHSDMGLVSKFDVQGRRNIGLHDVEVWHRKISTRFRM